MALKISPRLILQFSFIRFGSGTDIEDFTAVRVAVDGVSHLYSYQSFSIAFPTTLFSYCPKRNSDFLINLFHLMNLSPFWRVKLKVFVRNRGINADIRKNL